MATGPHQVLSCHLELRPQTGLDGSRPFVCLFNVQIRPTWMPVEKFQTLQRGCPQAPLGPAHTWKPGFACTRKGLSDSRTRAHTRAHTCKPGEPWSLGLPVGWLNKLHCPSSPAAPRRHCVTHTHKRTLLTYTCTLVYSCSRTSLPPCACPVQWKDPRLAPAWRGPQLGCVWKPAASPHPSPKKALPAPARV